MKGEDIAHTDAAEKQIDAFIERRERERLKDEEQQAVEDLWAISARKAEEKRLEEMRGAWSAYHRDQAARHRATLEVLIARHEAEAQKLMDQPKGGKE